MSEHPLLNLLIVDRSQPDIEFIVQTLRASGYLIQANYSAWIKEIRNLIDYRPLDMILVRQGADLPTIAEIHALLEASAQDVPVIAIADDLNRHRPVELLRAGATAVFVLREPDHLLAVVKQEFQHLQLRRSIKLQEQRIQETEERHRVLLEHSRDAIAYIHEGIHLYANPAYLQLFAYSSQEAMEGVTLMNLIRLEDRDKLKRLMRDSMKPGKLPSLTELTALDSTGHFFPIRLSCMPIRVNDEPCFQIVVQNPFEAQDDSTLQIEEPRTRDLLTGLYHRKFFIDQLNKLCNSPQGPSGAVLYILLTDYRAISKRTGLDAVDQLAGDIAKLLQQVVSLREVVARFADAVFTIYTPESMVDGVLKLAERLSTAIRVHTTQAVQGLINTTSAIGICLIEKTYENASQIISLADQACDSARQAGGNQVQLYTPPVPRTGAVRQEAEIMAQIREAVSRERMQLLYQPIASFQGDSTERYKASLRILGEDAKPLAMTLLAPVAEKRGLMGPLDKWAILKALEALAEREGRATKLFIHLSQNSMLQKDFCKWLEKRLQDTGLSGGTLVIEVTEEYAETYFQETKALREQLQAIGCGFTISQFGNRANSEHILTKLAPEYIKLDSDLIEQIVRSKNEASRQALAAITEKARQMKTLVIAANIASAPQMASIWQFGVTLVQGDMVQEASPHMDFDFQQFAG
ncbi:MAG: EAL domain-containing protein [Candidatus Competibacteraceae bacterium]